MIVGISERFDRSWVDSSSELRLIQRGTNEPLNVEVPTVAWTG